MNSHQNKIAEANRFLHKAQETAGRSQWKPRYHLSPPTGWMNDPNGFCFYKGEYHLFYQHHPFTPIWGPMYWGHAKSADLALWENLPIALAPSEDYDQDGCFSGSAIEQDGKLILMYTGHTWTGPDRDSDLKQVQCLAVSEDGIVFEKFEQNPVISSAPEGDIHPVHFRDPKVWKSGENYLCVIGSRTHDHIGQVLLYRSKDPHKWDFVNVLAKGELNPGFMWECPDMFKLDGADILMMSPQGMTPEGHLYNNLHQSGYVIGQLDEQTGKFNYGDFHLLDYGFDVYAPQTTIDDQGRRIMMGWMAMWESDMPEQKDGWAGAMTLPRQLTLKNGRIYSNPVAELQKLRLESGAVEYQDVVITEDLQMKDVVGDCLEMEIRFQVEPGSRFGMKLRCDEAGTEETVLTYEGLEGLLVLNRDKSGKGPGGVRKAPVEIIDQELSLRVFIDRSSVEIFINDGAQVMTARIYPGEQAQGIRFFADQPVRIKHLKKWSLRHAYKS